MDNLCHVLAFDRWQAMSTMLKVMRLDLPGEWADGWLYKNHLILWSRTGQIYHVPLDILASTLRKKTSPGLSVAAEYLLFRNDWKTSEQFRRILAVPGVERSFLHEFRADAESTVVSLDDFEAFNVGSEPTPGVGLDTAIYANRVYVGSTEGLFETRFDPNHPSASNPLISRLGLRTASVSAGHSVVNSSADEDGLWFSRVLFGEGDWWSDETEGGEFERIAEVSRGNSFASIHLLNYTDDPFPTFMRSEIVHERPHDRAQYAEWKITGYSAAADIGKLTASTLRSSRKVLFSEAGTGEIADAETAQVLGNSDYRLLLTWHDSLHVIDIAAYRGREIEAKPDTGFRGISTLDIRPASILETYAFGGGFLLELQNEVRLINPKGSHRLIGEPVARVRTFAHSRRYREVALVVRENGVSLIGFFTAQEDMLGW